MRSGDCDQSSTAGLNSRAAFGSSLADSVQAALSPFQAPHCGVFVIRIYGTALGLLISLVPSLLLLSLSAAVLSVLRFLLRRCAVPGV